MFPNPKRWLLVIGGDEEDFERTQGMFRQTPGQLFDLEWAPTYEIGHQQLCTHLFEAVFVDCDLGARTGIELIREFVAQGYQAPFILYTNNCSSRINLDALEAGAVLSMARAGASPELLERTVNYAVERKQEELTLKKELAERQSVALFPDENPNPVMRVSAQGSLIYANNASQILLKEWGSENSPRLLPDLLAASADAFNTGTVREFEVGCGNKIFSFALAPLADQGYINVYGNDITGRVKTEEMLRKLSRTVEQSPSSVVITDINGNIEYVNPKFTELTGYTFDEVSGKNPRILKSGWTPIEQYQSLWTTILSGGQWQGEFCNQKKNGEYYWESASISPITNDKGAITHFVAVKENITERKRAEEALRDSEHRLSLIVDSIADGFYALDREWRFTHVNDAALEYFKMRREDMLGRSIFEVFPTISGTAFEIEYRRAIASGEPVHLEAPSVVTSKMVEIYAYPGPDILTVLFRDVTGRYRMEAALRESEERYRSLFNGMTEGFAIHEIITDEAGAPYDYRFLDINPAFERLTGLQREAVVGKTYREILPNDDPQWVRIYGEVALTGKPVHFDNRSPALKKHYEVYSYRPAPMQFAVIFLDITERKQAEAALQTYAERLKERNQELLDFAFIASHDLREPLRKVQAFGDRLLTRYSQVLDDPGRDYIQRMQNAASRMESMLDGLLAYSRVTTQGQAFEEVDLYQVAADVLSDLEVRITNTGGQVILDGLPVVEGDPVQLRQLIQNLVGNGLKFHRPDTPPRVKVSGRQISEDWVELRVEDDGIGFDMRYARLLFKPFQRINERSVYEGNGMGLAICRKIVERHGGTITARGELGKGASFIVTLPYQRREALAG